MADLSRVIPSIPDLGRSGPAPLEGEGDPFAPAPRLRRPRPERVQRLLAAIDPEQGPGRPSPGPAPRGPDATAADPAAAAFAAGERAAAERFAEERARLQAAHEAALEATRTAASAEAGAALAERHAAAVSALADNLDAALSAALAPVLAETARRHAVDRLVCDVHRILTRRPDAWLELTGPPPLVASFRERLGPDASAVHVVEDDEETDLRLLADNTIFATTIAAFVAEVEAAAHPRPAGEGSPAAAPRRDAPLAEGDAVPTGSTPRIDRPPKIAAAAARADVASAPADVASAPAHGTDERPAAGPAASAGGGEADPASPAPAEVLATDPSAEGEEHV